MSATMLQVVIAILLAAAGSFARILNQTNKDKVQFFRTASSLFIAMFSGVLIYFMTTSFQFDTNVSYVLSGLCGWVGPQSMDALANMVSQKLGIDLEARAAAMNGTQDPQPVQPVAPPQEAMDSAAQTVVDSTAQAVSQPLAAISQAAQAVQAIAPAISQAAQAVQAITQPPEAVNAAAQTVVDTAAQTVAQPQETMDAAVQTVVDTAAQTVQNISSQA